MSRKDPVLKLKCSPLVLVLSQVRFPAVLKIGDLVPDLQESLRKQGYSRYSKENIQQITFGGPEPKMDQDNRWVFTSRDRSEAVILTTTSVTYETSNYDVFETLAGKFKTVLELIGSAAEIEYAEQIGLRYVDLIRPSQGKVAGDFLKQHVRGLSKGELGASHVRHQFMTQAQTEHGDLFVRSFENTGPNFMPPDLDSKNLGLKITPEDLNEDELCRVLDVDHMAKGEFEFSASILIEKLWDLHEYAGKAFRAAVTEDAMQYWKEG